MKTKLEMKGGKSLSPLPSPPLPLPSPPSLPPSLPSSSLLIVPEGAAEPHGHHQLGDPDHNGRHVYAVVVHWLEVADHVEYQEGNDQSLPARERRLRVSETRAIPRPFPSPSPSLPPSLPLSPFSLPLLPPPPLPLPPPPLPPS